MPLYRYIGGQVLEIPIGLSGGAAGLLRYVGGQVIRPILYRYIGGQVVNISNLYVPSGDFTPGSYTGTAPVAIQFATPTATTYLWNFGDGATSVKQNPLHIFVNPGAFVVSLTVTSPAGSGTRSKTFVFTSGLSSTPLVTTPTLAPSTSLTTQG